MVEAAEGVSMLEELMLAGRSDVEALVEQPGRACAIAQWHPRPRLGSRKNERRTSCLESSLECCCRSVQS